MRIMLDTNVMIDILERREPFFTDSYLVLRNALLNGDLCMMPVSVTTDIAYILRKNPNMKTKLLELSDMVTLTDVLPTDFQEALNSEITDFEDALLVANAKRNKADCIVTRNAKDFVGSQVDAVTPKELLRE